MKPTDVEKAFLSVTIHGVLVELNLKIRKISVYKIRPVHVASVLLNM